MPYKRSKEPVFWGLFGFGGMVISFALPALLVCLIIAGFGGPFHASDLIRIMRHWWGAGALFLIVLGIAFHCMHRIYFSLQDLRLHPGTVGHVVLYGIALLLTVAAGVGLGFVYFGGV